MVNSSSLPSSRTATRVSSDSALMMTSLWMLLDRLDQPLNFLDDRCRGGADGFHDALAACLGTWHRLKRLLLPATRRASVRRLRLARIRCSWLRFDPRSARAARLPAASRRRHFPRARFPAAWRAVKDLSSGRRLVADDFGAGFRGLAVGLLRRHVPARRWGGSACRRAGAGKNFCHSY